MRGPGKKGARQSDPGNAEVKAMDLLLQESPPVITWLKNKRGVWVHTSINDPHMDSVGGRNTDKQVCKRNHPFDEANTLLKSDGTRQCRECKTLWNKRRRTL